ncbi:DJ-1/PfpI family protein [Fusibacter paucivorans]|uniref:DJ-1/PfpI family protein n=1 Tax=Fusibacter paucivorans TaxID=76009 RepID=A0ABS5PTS8_9FIRM|nr:DJ-1/PfpI family protein [Fusibacter paucivorans]MBS7528491.1 DJ-1/PfpI family protein [Fusibacter paucivorans]
MMYHINLLLFDQFELLDAFGPAEIFGKAPEIFTLHYYSRHGGVIKSAQDTQILTEIYASQPQHTNILLLPGGEGTRQLVQRADDINDIKRLAEEADYVLSVCTGAALLAKAGVLDGKRATTNKRAFEWVKSQRSAVDWVKRARWVKDDKYYTSSGITAGMDMSLGFINDIVSPEKAREISKRIEYIWHEDSSEDPFADLYEG